MLYVILGKSCSGKTTLADKLSKKYKIDKIITSTSRPRRKSEEPMIDYFFYDYDTMKKEIDEGKYIEHTEFNGWLYGTKFSDIDINKDSIIVLNPEGYRKLKQLYGYKVIGIYINPLPFTRLFRILKRDKNYIESFRRFIADIKDFKNLKDVIEIKKVNL